MGQWGGVGGSCVEADVSPCSEDRYAARSQALVLAIWEKVPRCSSRSETGVPFFTEQTCFVVPLMSQVMLHHLFRALVCFPFTLENPLFVINRNYLCQLRVPGREAQTFPLRVSQVAGPQSTQWWQPSLCCPSQGLLWLIFLSLLPQLSPFLCCF